MPFGQTYLHLIENKQTHLKLHSKDIKKKWGWPFQTDFLTYKEL